MPHERVDEQLLADLAALAPRYAPPAPPGEWTRLRVAARRRRLQCRTWPLGLAAAAGLASAVWLHPWPAATVVETQGTVIAASGDRGLDLAPGSRVDAGDNVATAGGSRAVLELRDGSRVTLDSATSAVFSSGLWSRTVRLDAGRIMVRAAKQRWGRHLYVSTDDCAIAVVGTLFAVARDPAGTRVSVGAGVVKVTAAGRTTPLTAGRQFITQPNVARVPLAADLTLAAPPAPPKIDAAVAPLPQWPPAQPAPQGPPPILAGPLPPKTPATPPLPAPANAAAPPLRAPQQATATAPPAPAPPNSSLALALYHEAVRTTDLVPTEIQPMELALIGIQEEIRFKDDAASTLEAAFHKAVALSLPASQDDALGKFRQDQKGFVEEESIGLLVKLGRDRWQTARDLVRSANVSPRCDVYASLIDAANAGYGGSPVGLQSWLPTAQPYKPSGAPPAATPAEAPFEAPFYDVLPLFRECNAADGSFAYYAAITAVQKYGLDSGARLEIVRMGLTAAENEKTGRGVESSAALLRQAHNLAPELDAQTEQASETAVRRLADVLAGKLPTDYVDGLDPIAINELRLVGNSILISLAEFDASRAQELRTELPQFNNPGGLPSFNLNTEAAARQKTNDNADATLAVAQGMTQNSAPEIDAKFNSLVQVAMTLAEQKPAQAAQAADAALDLATHDLIAAHLLNVARLAMDMSEFMHQPARARQLAERCLDVAEEQAAAAAEALHAASPDARPGLYKDALGFPRVEDYVEVYGPVAKVDFPLALTRAEGTHATFLKPLMLMRAALGAPGTQP